VPTGPPGAVIDGVGARRIIGLRDPVRATARSRARSVIPTPTRTPLGRQRGRSAEHLREGTLATATDVKIKPLEDRVLVTIDEQEQTTASGLVIPDTAKEKPQQGTVIAVGPGKRSEQTGEAIALDVNEGDTVLFSKYGGTEVKLEGQEYLILSGRDILAVIG
jgi:chaperonin GroES